jgi:hypothetical protein
MHGAHSGTNAPQMRTQIGRAALIDHIAGMMAMSGAQPACLTLLDVRLVGLAASAGVLRPLLKRRMCHVISMRQ